MIGSRETSPRCSDREGQHLPKEDVLIRLAEEQPIPQRHPGKNDQTPYRSVPSEATTISVMTAEYATVGAEKRKRKWQRKHLLR